MAALKYIFCALLIGAVWAVVLLLGLPMWIAIVATVVIVAILLAYVIFKIVRAKKAAREIERALKAQADRHAAAARPDLRADVDGLQQEFLRAITALKSSKLGGKTGTEALYALPWYMIIGPPGAGKSTALRQSGLRFPYQSKSGGGVQGVGGTRNCQWWMTNEAVILDTAGRYTTEDADRDEWMSFLDLLKKNRPKQPINGVMVAIAVTDVSEAHHEDVHALARGIRGKIDEVMAKLEMIVPVYVVFTKMDLLPGFVEVFGDLGNTERRQIWGFTAPVTVKIDPVQTFAQQFDDLVQIVERRAVRRMGEERRIESRDKIYEFPQYFEPMKEKLALFVGELMAHNVYAESPYLRGVYFTSGTQEGRTIDRIMNSMAAAFGIQPKLAYTTPQIEPKSYFLGELFEKVIFPDKLIAQRSAAKMKKQAMIGVAIGAGLFMLAVFMALFPVVSFRNNRALLGSAADAVGKVEEHKASERKGLPIKLGQIDPLRGVERTLNEHINDGAPFTSRFGMYQGERIQPSIRQLYLRTVRDELIKPFVDITVDDLQRFMNKYSAVQEPVSEEEHRAYQERLRFYLLLTGIGKGGGVTQYPPPNEPGLDERQRGWLRTRIADQWRDALKNIDDVAERDTMLNIADAYIDIVATDNQFLFERDQKLVAGVRKILKRTDRVEALLAELLRDIEAPDISLTDLIASRKAISNDAKTVKGAYTRRAWDDVVAEKLNAPIADLLGDEWVLGWTEEEVKKNEQEQRELLRSKYFEEYIKAWKPFVTATFTKGPSDYAESMEILSELTAGTPPPLQLLCRHVEYNTTLDDPEPTVEEEEQGALGELAGAALEEAVAKRAAKHKAKIEAAKKKLLEDRKKRRNANPLLKINEDVKKEFADYIKFGCGTTPVVPDGAPPPPQAPVPLDSYQEQLKSVRDALKAKIDNESPESTAALAKAVDAALAKTDSLILEADTGGWVAGHLRKVLVPPLEALRRIAGKGVVGDLTNKYCSEVVEPMHLLLAKYPFKNEGAEISPGKFAEFFKPETGKLWVYYTSALSTRVPLKNNSFSIAKTGAASSANIDPKLVQFLNRALDLSRSLFPVGSDKMSVEFQLMIKPNPKAATTRVDIDGDVFEYINAPDQWRKFVWPGEGDKVGRIVVKGLGFNDRFGQESSWGLFRLLEDGTVSEGGSGSGFTVKYNLSAAGGGVLDIRFKPGESDINPFYGAADTEREGNFMSVFRHPDLVPPRSIVIGGPTCK
ncbi:MAG TPA: type VI secretion system membrane subunit TssM [Nannocystaceae bacterium]|nr:type VI secretion system membrane subunit TssM [Nannocystaceae bacterium]